jgi:hypothetical protein
MFCLRKTFLPALVFFFYSLAGAQTAPKNLFQNVSVGGHYSYGSYLISEPKAAYLKDSYSSFGELYVQVQTDGSKGWQVANGLPQWGIGLQYGNLGSHEHLGKLLAAFPFMNLRLFASGALKSKLRIGAGLGWVEKPYDAETNHKNVLIGSHLNAFLHLLWQNEVKLAPRIYASAGLGFSHLSNGGFTLPNLGVNTPTLQAGLRYALGEPSIQTGTPPDSFSRRLSYRAFASVAVKQYPWIGSKRYTIGLVSAEVSKRTSARHRFSTGVTIFYNPSLEIGESGLLSQKVSGNDYQAGLYGSYERHFGKLSLPIQFGVYLYNQDRFTATYQHIGLRYQLTGKLLAGALLKTHLGKAEYINLGLGYTLN